MATQPHVADVFVEKLSVAGDVTVRRMFGEYCVYLFGKPIALICDDQFFLKPTEAGRKLLKTVDEAPPYPGATLYFRLTKAQCSREASITKLLMATYEELPAPKPRKPSPRKKPAAAKPAKKKA